uniref:Uncharacterized protein n=1 Tax=Anguilla anguilla TaxID=7936 RepID=A0A0E9XSV8_ANGAN
MQTAVDQIHSNVLHFIPFGAFFLYIFWDRMSEKRCINRL